MEGDILVNPVFEDMPMSSSRYNSDDEDDTDEAENKEIRDKESVYLTHMEHMIKSFSDFPSLVIVRRRMGGQDYIQVFDRRADCGFFNNLQLVLFSEEDQVCFQLFSGHQGQQMVREAKIRRPNLTNPAPQVKSLVRTYLTELTAGRYEVCQGAFEESTFVGDISVIDLKYVLVEKGYSASQLRSGDVIFRSRDCTHLNQAGGGPCRACCDLKQSLKDMIGEERNTQTGDLEDSNGHEDFEESHGNISQYLEVSIDDDANRSTGSNFQIKEEVDEEMETGGRDDQRSNRPFSGSSDQTMAGHYQNNLSDHYKTGQNKKSRLSYKALILMAINDSEFGMLKLTDIYHWILERHPHFANNRTGFQNSIRHNLSLNKIFSRVGVNGRFEGKGGYWTINPRYVESSSPHSKMEDQSKSLQFSMAMAEKRMSLLLPKPQQLPLQPPMNPINSVAVKSMFMNSHPEQSYLKFETPKKSRSEEETLAIATSIKSEHDYQEPNEDLENQLSIEAPVENYTNEKSISPLPRDPRYNGASYQVSLGVAEGGGIARSTQPVTLDPRNSDQMTPGSLQKMQQEFLKANKHLKTSPSTRVQVQDRDGYYTVHKPNFSYKELIMLAIYIASSHHLGVCLNDIYLTIKHWFPYFQHKGLGATWQNSIRHNLSLNKCFSRIELQPNERYTSGTPTSKGGYWTFEESNETWLGLMAQPRKWFEFRKDNMCKTTERLLEFLKEKNSIFRDNVYSHLTPRNPIEEREINPTTSLETLTHLPGADVQNELQNFAPKHETVSTVD